MWKAAKRVARSAGPTRTSPACSSASTFRRRSTSCRLAGRRLSFDIMLKGRRLGASRQEVDRRLKGDAAEPAGEERGAPCELPTRFAGFHMSTGFGGRGG